MKSFFIGTLEMYLCSQACSDPFWGKSYVGIAWLNRFLTNSIGGKLFLTFTNGFVFCFIPGFVRKDDECKDPQSAIPTQNLETLSFQKE